MARTTKQGIDYFPMEVNLDDKMELLEAKYGLEGFAIVVKLWQKIYSNGYFINWDEEKLLLFKKAINVDINIINAVINDCLRWQLFDKCLHNKYQILTSRGIQNRYIEATQRRKEVEFIEEYLLIDDVKNRYKNDIQIQLKKINVNINSINADINSQSKVKESKREESKVEESIYNAHARVEPPQKHHHGEFKHVLLTDEEFKKLVEDYGELKAEEAINYVDQYIEMSGKKYKNHYLVIRKWGYEGSQKEIAEKSGGKSANGEYDALFATLDMY